MTKRQLAHQIYKGVPGYKTIYKEKRSWRLSSADPISENFPDCRYIGIPPVDWDSERQVLQFLSDFDDGVPV